MDQKVFTEIFDSWSVARKNEKFWTEGLAKEHGYKTPEAMRSDFKRQRKSMGIESKEVVPEKIPERVKTNAKILCFDIETSPLCCLTWGLWDQNINTQAILQDWHLISWSAKWLFSDEVISDVLAADEARVHNDSRITKSIWKLLDEADIVVSHNGDKFDCKRLNTRFLYNGLPPVSHYLSVDTLIVAKNVFNFSSNKLDYINNYLGIPQKTETGFELWKNAYFGDPKSLKMMEDYNRNDCEILEDLFLKLRPFIKNFPNLNLWSEENVSVCPNCGSKDLNWNGKYYYTYTGRYKAFRCDNCSAIGRSRELDLSKEKRKTIVR